MKPASILIVEDEAIVALDIKLQLEALGYRVVGIADSAEQALALARQHRPSLALLDIMLRGAADGIDAAAALRSELATPVVFLTSFSDSETVRRAAESAAYGYLTKPFQIKELTAVIEIALYKSRMENQLREADRWFASTLRCVRDAVVVVELDAKIRFMNPAAEALTGWPLEVALGQPVGRVVCIEEQTEATAHALRDGRVVGVEHGLRLRARGGEDVVVDRSAAPVDDDGGARIGAVVVLRDARDRLRQEERLRASEERFRNAFDFAPLGMILVALGGRVLLVNEALCRMLGRDASSLLNSRQIDLSHPDNHQDERQHLHDLLTGTAETVQFETRLVRSDNPRALPVLMSASMLHENGEPTCLLYQVHDLTEQKLAAQQLAELTAERMKREASEAATRLKSEFLSRVSHEMRTPLNAVLGFGQLLQMDAQQHDGTHSAYAGHIINAGKHLLNMVDDLLDIHRGEQGALKLEIQDVVLADAVVGVIEMLQPLADAQQIALHANVPPQVLVRADPKRLRQVLLNLGSNAIKYNRAGGTVRWTLQPSTAGSVRLAVQDDGIGMTADQLARLFQPFERLGRESSGVQGTGLGMLITRGLVEQMGGSMDVQSEPRRGTVVVMEFVGE